MKTITITSNGQNVQFTTKSVTIDGKEYLYSHISELRHSEAKRVYGFKCDGEVRMLPYEEHDAQTLSIIFSQVQQMHRKAKKPIKEASAAVPEDVPAQGSEPSAEADGYEPEFTESVPAEEPQEFPEETDCPKETSIKDESFAPSEGFSEITGSGEAAEAEPVPKATPAEIKKNEREARKEEKRRLKEQHKAEKEATRKKKQEEKEEARRRKQEAKKPAEELAPAEESAVPVQPVEEPGLENLADSESADEPKEPVGEAATAVTAAAQEPQEEIVTFSETEEDTITLEQKGIRFKKSIIVFLIVLAVFALAAIAWYFFIGPASDPQHGVNSTEDTTQYNDINDMINDLEE